MIKAAVKEIGRFPPSGKGGAQQEDQPDDIAARRDAPFPAPPAHLSDASSTIQARGRNDVKLTKTFMTMLTAGMLALSTQAIAQDKGTIGISMPTKSSARWIADGDNMVKVLESKGYKADLQYADNDIPNQLAQVENMITKKEKVLVIAAIDGTTLSNALQKAADAGIKVIAYDRLIRGSANVDYYATFDNFQVGVLQAQTI